MSYVNPDYKSKKDFKTAIGLGKRHETYNPSGMFPTTQNGTDVIEGPHYPQPHRWYAAVTVADGIVVASEGMKLGQLLKCAHCGNAIDATQAKTSMLRAPKAKPACADCISGALAIERSAE